jgi:hypothetical protein
MGMSKKPNNQGVINRDVNAAQRAAQAVQLRAKRLTYEQIAIQCGYASPGACRNAIMRELNRTIAPGVGNMRQEELSMLDQLHALLWPLVLPDGDEDQEDDDEESGKRKKTKMRVVDLFVVDRILAIAERRAKLMGLDKPVETTEQKNLLVIREVPIGLLPVVESTP